MATETDKQPINLAPLRRIKYWGASTSAHQVEGKNHNQWSVWELASANELARTAPDKLAHWLPVWDEIKTEATQPDNYVSSIAVDFYNRYEEDFDLLEKLNMNAFRFSIEWSRVEPKPKEWDYTAIEVYRKQLRSLKKRGIEPVVCLLHFTLPVWFDELGGFEKKQNIEYYTRFIEKITVELKDEFSYVLTMNEPNVQTSMTYMLGEWPGKKSPLTGVKHYVNLMRAHKRAYATIKHIKSDLIVGMAQHTINTYTEDNNPISKLNAKIRAYVWNWWFINRSAPYHDFIGVNYYLSDRVKGFKTDNPNEKQNDMGWDMQPYHLRYAVKNTYWKYKKPIMVTENGLADHKDKYRQWWLSESLKAMSDAIDQDGVEIVGYLHWSLLDNFEWSSGYWPRFGLVEVDRQTLKRTPRKSGVWFAAALKKIRKS